MAEAFAVGAGVVAFMQLADRVIGIAKYYIEAIHDCPGDIRMILVEISSLKAVLENLDFLLTTDFGPEPQLLEQLAGEHGPIEGCHKSVVELEKLLPTCIRTVQSKRQKVLTAAEHLAWPLRESSAKRLIDTISRYKASIAFALSYDSARDIKDVKKDVRLVKETLTLGERNEVCSWLESTDPSSNHNNAWELREDLTGLWILRTNEWQEWLEGKTSFLWIHGIPGAGKTILASFLIEQTQAACNSQIASAQKKMVACVYYYCHFSRNQDEAAPFVRWLVSQLSRQAKLIPNNIDRLFQLKHAPNISQLLSALEQILKEFESVSVIIDAVDESQSREDLLRILRDFVTDHRFDKIRLLATSREYYDIEQCFFSISSRVSMKNPVVEDDIRRYTHSVLTSKRTFRNWPQHLITEVEDALAKGAQGMFRWAVCQIDVLQRLGREKDVRRALCNLPKTLDETYQRIFELLPEEDLQFVRLALIYICGNNDIRPVPIAANVLLEAITFQLNIVHDGEDDNVGFSYHDALRDKCGCLISFSTFHDIESIALAHYTVKEFLYSDRITHGRVSNFALSESLVQTTFMEMALQFAIAKQDELDTIEYGSLHSYCLLAIIRLDYGGGSVWHNERMYKYLQSLTEPYEVIARSKSHILAVDKTIRWELSRSRSR